MNTRVVSATEFKSQCLSLLDDVAKTGESITVTKRGKPVAVLGPTKKKGWKSLAGSWAKRGRIVGDIVNVDTADLWDVVRQK